MPFSSEEKTKILFYLGYSVYEDDGPAMRSINSLDSVESRAGSIIRDLIAKIEKVDCEIQETTILAQAIKDGSIELRAHYTLEHLWRVGRSHVARLASFIKVSIFSDVFGPGDRPREPATFYSQDPSEHRIDPSSGVPMLGSGGPIY